MRQLTIRPRLGNASIEAIENVIQEKLPNSFSDFLKKNTGLSHYECIYLDKQENKWSISQYNIFKDLYGLTKEFLNIYGRKMVPFAYDPGGWHFCLCMDETDFGAIFINRWTDYEGEDQFLNISNSFEEFISGLKREDEVL